ncbi:MAG: MFS transporter [Candidatus Synoicihabitans palmerolidicus]|nr:MFS transporter [Candidatus Synoicihabitans palmerolidicus]
MFGCKRNAYIGLSLLTSGTACLYYFAGPGDVAMVYIIQGSTSLMMGPLMPLFWSMIADTADYSEWKFGRRFTGLTFSAGTFSREARLGVGSGLCRLPASLLRI